MKIYHIKQILNKKGIVFVPSDLFEIQEINAINFGTKIAPCISQKKESLHDTVEISSNLFRTLYIPFDAPCNVFIHEEVLYIAPLVGIFTAGFVDSPLRPLGDRSFAFADLLTNNTLSSYTFLFGAHHIKWAEGLIRGYFYSDQRWKQYDIPFPQVVYDRLPNRETENHQSIKRIKERLQTEYLIPWFNPGFFNKWDVYNRLKNELKRGSYLPETHLFTSFTVVEEMLAKYKYVYIKPSNGSLGARIFKVIYDFEEEVYYCRFRQDNVNKLRKYNTLEQLINQLFKDSNLEDFIVQQGISLIQVNSQPVDFRVHTNKNRAGKWEVSAIAGKIAGQGSMTTHVALGGEIQTLAEIFPDEETRDIIHTKLCKATLELSKTIDKGLDGYIGEIGFDIGIDKNEELWLFEANSKPGRSIFVHPNLKEYDQLTKELFISYASHLAEKVILSPEEIYQ